jgi:hypothetical protein
LGLKEILEERQESLQWKTYRIAKEYGRLKDGQEPNPPDRYYHTVRKILEKPDQAEFENLKRVFWIMGVDIEAAIAAAAAVAPLPKAD